MMNPARIPMLIKPFFIAASPPFSQRLITLRFFRLRKSNKYSLVGQEKFGKISCGKNRTDVIANVFYFQYVEMRISTFLETYRILLIFMLQLIKGIVTTSLKSWKRAS